MGGNAVHLQGEQRSDFLTSTVLAVFQKHTGYGPEHLEPDAELEGELGIDSITLAEILADIYQRCELGHQDTQPGAETLSQVIDHVRSLMGEEQPQHRAPAPETQENPSEPEPEPAQVPTGDVLEGQVLTLLSAHTGYSRELLVPEVHLEEDLGIDSVTRVSVLADIASALGLDCGEAVPEDIATIDSVLRWLHSRQARESVGAPVQEVTSGTDAVTEKKTEESSEDAPIAPPGDPDSPATAVDSDNRTMKDFVALRDPDLFRKAREFRDFYQRKREQELYWYGMPLTSGCRNRAMIYDDIAGCEREFLMFASNNYLGLANHPRVIDAIADAARSYGATNTGCRLIGGSNVLHGELERRLAELKGREACIVYPSGYSANLGCISALAGPHDLVFTDALNHMSIQDGCKLSGAGRRIYQHSLESLAGTLEKHRDHNGGKLIVTDGVFSMHGDIVDLPGLMELAEEHGARVLVDDAHSTGVLGRKGSGTTEHFHMKGGVDLEVGTMSKALSGLGGFVCADEEVVEYLRFYSHSYVFAATIPAPVVAGLIAALEVMEEEPQRLSRLWRNVHQLRGELLESGFNLERSESAILPVVVGDDQKTLEFGRAVRRRGMFCQTVVYPGVAVGDARLRISVTSEHTDEDLAQAAEIIRESARETGIPFRA